MKPLMVSLSNHSGSEILHLGRLEHLLQPWVCNPESWDTSVEPMLHGTQDGVSKPGLAGASVPATKEADRKIVELFIRVVENRWGRAVPPGKPDRYRI